MKTSNLKRNMKAIGWMSVALLFLVPSVATAAVTFAPNLFSSSEGDGAINFQISCDIADTSSEALTVHYSFTDNTATGGSTPFAPGIDYDNTSGSVSIPKGATTATISVAINPDAVVEEHEKFTVTLTDGGATTYDTATGTIQNDDAAMFTVADASNLESNGSVDFTVTLGTEVDSAVTVTATYISSTETGDTATLTTDYAGTTGTVSFAGGSVGDTRPFSVATVKDGIVELDETFTVTLTDGGAKTYDTATGTIENSDTATFSVVDSSALESAGSVDFDVQLDSDVATGVSVTVNYKTAGATATEGTDYTDATGVLTFIGGSIGDTQSLPVTVTNDGIVETNETFTLTLTDGGATTYDTATGTIQNDDTATLSIDDVSVTEGGTASFTVTLSSEAAVDVTVGATSADGTATIADGDFGSASSPVTITAGNLTGTVTVPVTDDGIVETAETFVVNLSNPSGAGLDVGDISLADGTGQATITDNNGTAYVSINNVSVNEGSGAATFTVSISPRVDTPVDVTVGYGDPADTATTGSDYTAAPTTVTIPALSYSVTFDVGITNDDLVEQATEAFTLTLSNPTATTAGRSVELGTATGQGTITDDDGGATVSIGDVTVAEGDSQATFTVSLDKPVDIDLTVDLRTANGSATAGSDYEAVVDSTVPNTVVFSAGTTAAQTFSVPIINGTAEIETDETFTLNATGVTANDRSVALGGGTCTITDNDYRVTAAAFPEGTISIDSGSVSANSVVMSPNEAIIDGGSGITFNLTWDHAFQTILDSGPIGSISTIGTSGTYTIASVNEDHMIQAVFRHRIDMTVGANGSATIAGTTVTGSGSGYVIVDHTADPINGEGPEATITPSDGSHCVRNVMVDGVSVGAVTSYDFPPVDQSMTFEALFRDNLFTVYIEPAEVQGVAQWRLYTNDSGTWEPVTDWYGHGETVPTACNASFKIEFSEVPGWIKPDPVYFEITTATIDYPTYTVSYSPLTVTLGFLVDPGGVATISADQLGTTEAGPGQYLYQTGTNVTLTVGDSKDWDFGRWEEDGTVLGTDPSLIITMNEDRVITARFIQHGADNDQDGWPSDNDCDDSDPSIHPEAPEICGDGIDQDCDGADQACGPDDTDDDGDGYTENQGDCNDSNAAIHPGAEEICGNGTDEDCYDGDRPCSPEFTCVDISDVPLDTSNFTATANVMFVVDDSGSMDAEIMMFGADDFSGYYKGTYLYLFDDKNDNYYTPETKYTVLGDTRREWKTQSSDHNTLYYNPDVIYEPWSRWNLLPKTQSPPADPNADPDYPRRDPVQYDSHGFFDLDTPYISFGLAPAGVEKVVVSRQAGAGGSSTMADAVALVPHDKYTEFMNAQDTKNNYGADITGVMIIDDLDFAFRSSGDWLATSDKKTAWADHGSFTTVEGDYAEWLLSVPAGDYYVFAWVNEYLYRDPRARYDIVHNGTTISTDMNQALNGGQWFQLHEEALIFAGSSPPETVTIPSAHYYTQVNGSVYLVTLDGHSDGNPDTGTIAVYSFTDSDGDDYVDDGEMTVMSEVDAKAAGAWPIKPDGTPMTFIEARQNFANYYSFYRRRELAAKAAVSHTIEAMRGVNIGLFSIQQRIKEPCVPVDVEGFDDGTEHLLNVLYSEYWSAGDTPLRTALLKVGQYYHQDDGYTGGITANTSPYYAEEDGGGCQKAFTVLMTDGYYNGNLPAAEVDKNFNADGDDNTEFDGGEFADDENQSLADVAMFYYENDIAQGLSDYVPPTGFDTGRHQHMVTYSVAFGVHGSIDPADWPNCPPDCDPSDANCVFECPDWPDLDSNEEKIDDLWHAAVNGRGLFLSADNPNELRDALMRIKEDIEKKTRSGAAVSVNAQELSTDTVLYQAIYNTDGWQGDLRSKCLDPNNGDIVDCTSGLALENEDTLVGWSANHQLESRGTTTDSVTGDVIPNRQIITYAGGLGVPFDYGSLTPSQQSLLGAIDEGTGRRMVNYLRGSATYERRNGGSFRNRKASLGDFVHSAPTLVTGVGDFGDENLIFVGGNDGMLHVFDADNGEEVFAYVPNLVFKNLADLVDPYYTHKFFVDNTVFGAKVNDRTLVVGTLGKGGKGVYCLDVTAGATGLAFDAETDANNVVKWEYPGPAVGDNDVSPDADMGYGFSRAYLVNSNHNGSDPVVIFGNGYQSTNGRAVLYILDVDGGLVRKIDTGVGDPLHLNTSGVGDANNYNCNGLSTPALVDTNLDGTVDYAYAGDLLGNLWKFDLTDSDAANWRVSYNDGSGPQPFFQAVNAQNQRQPITSRPDVMMPCGAFQGGYMVVFSTGRYLGTDDLADTTVQSVYAVWDWQAAWEATGAIGVDKYLGHFQQPDANGFRSFSNMANIVDNTEQVTLQQQFVQFYDDINGLRVLSDNPVEWTDVPPAPQDIEHMGWYFDFPGSRERAVQDVTITGGYVILITNLPDSSPCSSAGSSFMHVLNACTGGRMNYPAIDLNGDGLLNSDDLVNVGSGANPVWVAPSGFKGAGMWYTPAIISLLDKSGDLAFSSTSEGTIEKIKLKADPVGMYYWREIN
jgi:type IV pilus assembly protein PilY1